MSHVWIVTVTYAGDGLASWFNEVYETEKAALAAVTRLIEAGEQAGREYSYEVSGGRLVERRHTWRYQTDSYQDVVTLEEKEVQRED